MPNAELTSPTSDTRGGAGARGRGGGATGIAQLNLRLYDALHASVWLWLRRAQSGTRPSHNIIFNNVRDNLVPKHPINNPHDLDIYIRNICLWCITWRIYVLYAANCWAIDLEHFRIATCPLGSTSRVKPIRTQTHAYATSPTNTTST